MEAAERLARSSLDDIVDIPGHVCFVEDLLGRYDLDSSRKDTWTAALGRIRTRQTDPDLYLAVVGEFTSGKSSLVNALIRQELLPTDVLPATTAAATLVRYGDQPRLRVDYIDGRHEEFLNGHGQPSQSLGPLVHRVTAIEEVASTVTHVTVHYPAPVLRQGLVVVDTPGANVENPRHVELAGWVLRELCDAAIVAVPASIPVADTLADFLRVHLQDSLHRCVFLATKIDSIPERDRPRLLEMIASRLTSKLGIEKPVVLPASAIAALGKPLADGTDSRTLGPAGEAYRALQAQFMETEETIARTLQEQRTLILLERLSSLVSTVLDGLKAELEAVEQRYQVDHAALEANRIRELAPYIEQSKARHGKSLALQLDPLVINGREMVAASRKRILEQLKIRIDKAVSRIGLENVVSEAAWMLGEEARALQEKLGTVFSRIREAAQEEIDRFEAKFLRLHPSLQTLDGRIMLDGVEGGKSLPRDFSPVLALALTPVIDYMREVSSKINSRTWVGALIGCLFCGVGAIPGAIIGNRSGPPLEELRRTCWDKSRSAMDNNFSALGSAIDQQLRKAQDDVRRQLSQTIDRYFDQYDSLFQRMVSTDQQRARELDLLRRKVQDDLSSLEQRRRRMQQARAGLQGLHKL